MENKPEGFDRANGQGQNHDTAGNVANADNNTLGQNTGTNEAPEVETVTPDNDAESIAKSNDGSSSSDDNGGGDSSNKGKGPSGENL
ncbi:hypothetical protein DYU05_06775 [Mucilaginibacter terrenus]|uniref:Uncharacterized protein n=1 Tax=Mucilaginibacter terrenus TaxID=2482727 RepID=A0A3E2NWA1_9SPHI|nr:hypothetical protein [Mucilaginibacter terrenus]RFZ85294.1 hypothetical protein DYU05_06775 [Mucilaginibacter terrenus]